MICHPPAKPVQVCLSALKNGSVFLTLSKLASLHYLVISEIAVHDKKLLQQFEVNQVALGPLTHATPGLATSYKTCEGHSMYLSSCLIRYQRTSFVLTALALAKQISCTLLATTDPPPSPNTPGIANVTKVGIACAHSWSS